METAEPFSSFGAHYKERHFYLPAFSLRKSCHCVLLPPHPVPPVSPCTNPAIGRFKQYANDACKCHGNGDLLPVPLLALYVPGFLPALRTLVSQKKTPPGFCSFSHHLYLAAFAALLLRLDSSCSVVIPCLPPPPPMHLSTGPMTRPQDTIQCQA